MNKKETLNGINLKLTKSELVLNIDKENAVEYFAVEYTGRITTAELRRLNYIVEYKNQQYFLTEADLSDGLFSIKYVGKVFIEKVWKYLEVEYGSEVPYYIEELIEANDRDREQRLDETLSKKYYNESELTQFGEYLLSDERKKFFEDRYSEEDNISLEERLSNVYHSDYTNWLEKRK